MSFKVKLEIFEGPLDLLLYLVKKNHINIYDIPIAKIADEYMYYLELMRSLDLNIAGEFLVVAATLMQMKSRMLLPDLEEKGLDEVLEEEKQDLINQLIEYEKFKEIAEELRRKRLARESLFSRSQPPEVKKTEKEKYFEASIFDLLTAFSKVIKELPVELFYEAIKDEFTVEEKIHEILHLLLENEEIKLSILFDKAKNKMEIIVTFLAILELIRLKEIKVIQKQLFGEIEIIRNTDNIIPYGETKDKSRN
jgi:segregation and condensation protein A